MEITIALQWGASENNRRSRRLASIMLRVYSAQPRATKRRPHKCALNRWIDLPSDSARH
jgi:hypothetical protein